MLRNLGTINNPIKKSKYEKVLLFDYRLICNSFSKQL